MSYVNCSKSIYIHTLGILRDPLWYTKHTTSHILAEICKCYSQEERDRHTFDTLLLLIKVGTFKYQTYNYFHIDSVKPKQIARIWTSLKG